MKFDWEIFLIGFFLVTALLGGIFLGNQGAYNANEQDNKFQIECVKVGGEVKWDPIGKEKICFND